VISLRTVRTLLFILVLAALTARAETPYEQDQRQQLEKYQREHGLSPQVQQRLRWEKEWREQHPGQPLPSAGALQKLHQDEIIANIKAGGARMWAARQAELQRNYELSRDNQQRRLAAQHITWTPQQWRQWDRQYDQEQQQRAQDYLKAVELSGEMARREHEREEQERLWRQR
jgi:hypothetical protein